MVAAPGEIFYYSNIAYNVLGVLITRITGQNFEDYMKEHILLPAGMFDSTLFYPEVDPKRLAVPHLRTPEMIANPVYPYHRADAPASFLHTTVIDMCHWAITCLNQGIYNGQRILSEASYQAMWTPVAQREAPPFYEHTGLGWTLGHYDGLRTVSHGGGGFGWTDFLLLLPEKNSALVILCNEESSARSRTIRAALHCLLDREPEVGKVSWMIPINQALCEGGIQAAYERYETLKDAGDEKYFLDEDELISLTYQLMNVENLDLTIEVLKLNLHVYPRHLESYTRLADCYLRKNERRLAVQSLQQALEIDPNCTEASEKLKTILQ
jgi:CubicO group peptidase (beta-lactamase class C family)